MSRRSPRLNGLPGRRSNTRACALCPLLWRTSARRASTSASTEIKSGCRCARAIPPTESTNRAYRAGTLQLLPSSENVFLMLRSGWHPSEHAPDQPTLTWQWTQKQAVFTFKNPKKDVTLYLEFDARADLFPDKKPVVTVSVGDQPITSIDVGSGAKSIHRVPVSSAQLGGNDLVEMRLDVDQTFTPAKLAGGGRDARELGIRVYNAFIEVR